MADKSDEKIAQERASVAAMRNAQSNMTAVLDRVATLERALTRAQNSLSRCKGYVGPNVYIWTDNNRQTCHAEIEAAVSDIAKVLA